MGTEGAGRRWRVIECRTRLALCLMKGVLLGLVSLFWRLLTSIVCSAIGKWTFDLDLSTNVGWVYDIGTYVVAGFRLPLFQIRILEGMGKSPLEFRNKRGTARGRKMLLGVPLASRRGTVYVIPSTVGMVVQVAWSGGAVSQVSRALSTWSVGKGARLDATERRVNPFDILNADRTV